MSDLLLGIDVGTSSVKVGIFDAGGMLLGLGWSAHSVDVPHLGWAQIAPELWWNGILHALPEACHDAGVRPDEVKAIGLSVLFPAVTPLDGNGCALYPAILYCDQRSLAQVRAIEKKVPRETYQSIIGNRLMPGTCAATSISWLRDEAPRAYEASAVLAFANTFVAARLTGAFYADPTMVALSGLADINDQWHWSEDLCRKLGVNPDRLPAIAGSAEIMGSVTRRAAEATGLKAGTPVGCGAGDTVCCAVGAGVSSASSAVYIAGSTDGVAAPLRHPMADPRWVNCAFVCRDTWLGIATTSSSGVSVEWFTREFLQESGPDALRRMTELAAASPAGSGGLLYLPYLQGERTPVWDPLARGAFVGLSTGTTRRDLARAVFEGTAFSVRQLLESVEDIMGGAVQEIRAVGGGTRNPLWNQIKADVLQRPLHVLEFQEVGALGAALLAGVGLGVYGSFEDAMAVARAAVPVRTVEPDPAKAGLYENLFQLYTKLYPMTRDISHALTCCRPAAEEGSVSANSTTSKGDR